MKHCTEQNIALRHNENRTEKNRKNYKKHKLWITLLRKTKYSASSKLKKRRH